MKVSAAMLCRLGACEEQVNVFTAMFGPLAVVEVTEALCIEHATKFNWHWAARNLLPAPLGAEYEAKVAPLWAEYKAKRASLWDEYEAKLAPLWAEYKAKLASLFGRLAETV